MVVRGLFGLVLLAGLAAALVVPAQAEPPAAVQLAAVEPAPLALVPPPASAAPAVAVKPVVPPKPAVTLVAKADLTRQILTVTEHGKTLASWPISSGVEDHATPIGTFQPEWTAKLWFSKTYDNAPMPNAVFFKDGAAIHATQAVGALGRAASHGCVRLSPANAETFYKLVQRHGLARTRISVFGTPHYSQPMIARRDVPSTRRMASAGGNHGFWGEFGGGSSWTYGYERIPIAAARYR